MATASATSADWLQLPVNTESGQDNHTAAVYFDPHSLMRDVDSPYWYTFNLIYNMTGSVADTQTGASSSVVRFTADCSQRRLRFERRDNFSAPDGGGELIETMPRGSAEFSALADYGFDTEVLFGFVCGP